MASGDLFKGFPVRFSMKNMQHVKVLEKLEDRRLNEGKVKNQIYRNSHTVYFGNPEEGQELFFRILMSRNLTPEQRADILMNGTVRV